MEKNNECIRASIGYNFLLGYVWETVACDEFENINDFIAHMEEMIDSLVVVYPDEAS